MADIRFSFNSNNPGPIFCYFVNFWYRRSGMWKFFTVFSNFHNRHSQGPNCNIEEILDPKQENWDIFQTAPPDTSVVWRQRLPTDPPEMEQPDPAKIRRMREQNDSSTSRPSSEISANTSRIWKSSRPFSDVSDSDVNSTNLQETPKESEDPSVSPYHHDGKVAQNLADRYDFDEDSSSPVYCHSSRDFLERYSYEKNDTGTGRVIVHKQSDSMLIPWRTEWIINDSERLFLLIFSIF